MGWTCTGFQGAPQLRQALMRAPTPEAALALINEQIRVLSEPAAAALAPLADATT